MQNATNLAQKCVEKLIRDIKKTGDAENILEILRRMLELP